MRIHLVLGALALVACKGGDDTAVAPPTWCSGQTTHQWDPDGAEEPDFFPAPNLFVADSSTPTGWALEFTDERVPWRVNAPGVLAESMDLFNEMSGTGTSGGVLVRFSAPVGPVPASADESLAAPGWQLWDLDANERVPFEIEAHPQPDAVTVWPLRPLRRDTRHAFVLTAAAQDASGGCIAPAEPTKQLLYGEVSDPSLETAATWSRDALDQLGIAPGDVSAITVFHTHNDIVDVEAAAAAIKAEPVSWRSRGDCSEQSNGMIRCEGSFEIMDFRDDRGVVDASLEPRRGELPVTMWLPPDTDGPVPVILYGHGLGGARTQGNFATFAANTTPYAVVAIDSVEHGDHPFKSADSTFGDTFAFMGIDVATFQVDGYAVRGNFDQTALDRLRLIELLKADPDLDGDGTDDIDPGRMGYVGVSLGGITGNKLLALSSDIDAAVLSVPGARLLSLLLEMDVLDSFLPAITTAIGGPDALALYHGIAQHPIDPSDPGTFATHVLHDRWDDAPAPHVLMQVAMADEVVDPTAGHTLARALDIPHMQPVAQTVPLLPVVTDNPVQGNLNGSTAAFFQFSTVTYGGREQEATHVDTPFSTEYRLQTADFLQDWVNGDTPRVFNPY